MKILITGATGFIGRHLINRLSKEGHTIHVLVRPSTKTQSLFVPFYIFDSDVKKLTEFIKKERFDGVIHLSSLFLASHKEEDIKNLIDSNIFFSTALLEASTKAEINWFINTGTFWQHYQDKKYSPVNLYSATKQAFEDIALFYIETSNIDFVTIKLSDTFGPNDTRPKIFNLWNKISISGEILEMSPGNQIVDISYIDDIVSGFIKLSQLLQKDIKRKLNGRVFAIKAKKRMTLKKLASVFEKATGKKLNIKWGAKEYRLREVMKPWTKGRGIPGWRPSFSIEKGIKKTFNSDGN